MRNFSLSDCHHVCLSGHLSRSPSLDRPPLRRNSSMVNICITAGVQHPCHDTWKPNTSWRGLILSSALHWVPFEVPQSISLASVLALVFCYLGHIPDTDSIEKKGLLLVHGLSSVGPGLAPSNATACGGLSSMLTSYQKTCGGANQPRTAVTGSRDRIPL